MKTVYSCELAASGSACKKDGYVCGGECHYDKNENIYNTFFFDGKTDGAQQARCPKSKLLTKFLSEPSADSKLKDGIDFIGGFK